MNGEVCAAEVRVLKRVWRRGGGLQWGLWCGPRARRMRIARVSKEAVRVGRGGLGGRLFQRIAWMGKGCVSDFE